MSARLATTLGRRTSGEPYQRAPDPDYPARRNVAADRNCTELHIHAPGPPVSCSSVPQCTRCGLRDARGATRERPTCETWSVPTRTIALDGPLDLGRTVGIHQRGTGRSDDAPRRRRGDPGDPDAGRAGDDRASSRSAAGSRPRRGDRARTGRSTAVPALVGLDDDRTGFEPDHHPLVAELDRRQPRHPHRPDRGGPRGAHPGDPRAEGHRHARRGAACAGIVRRWGEPAPGPFGLRLLPAPGGPRRGPVPRVPSARRRAPPGRPRPAGRRSRRAVRGDRRRCRATTAYARLTALPGIGPWTAAEVVLRALGDPDAVSVGDFHLPNVVGLRPRRRDPRDDGRMLELLEPWRGQRARVIRLLESSGLRPPAFGPRYAPRSIAAI